MHEEYKYRYGKDKIHKSYNISDDLPVPELSKLGITTFAQVVPEKYRDSNVVKACRDYYINEKHEIALWTKRKKPYWFR